MDTMDTEVLRLTGCKCGAVSTPVSPSGLVWILRIRPILARIPKVDTRILVFLHYLCPNKHFQKVAGIRILGYADTKSLKKVCKKMDTMDTWVQYHSKMMKLLITNVCFL